jgi:hypothetical protein
MNSEQTLRSVSSRICCPYPPGTPVPNVCPPGPARTKPASDLDLQEWVYERYRFVPHPYWIAHCKELYLNQPLSPESRAPWHECPTERRAAIKDAFLHFGLLAD